MALQIANQTVVGKVDRLAKLLGTTKTAAVEQAVDMLLRQTQSREERPLGNRIDALLAQLDSLKDRADVVDPLEWDEQGLPK